mgnify:CR=1 FL=1
MFPFIKMISAIMAFVMSMLPLVTPPEEQKCNPEFTGTFIQSWMSSSWDDERWAEEIENMENSLRELKQAKKDLEEQIKMARLVELDKLMRVSPHTRDFSHELANVYEIVRIYRNVYLVVFIHPILLELLETPKTIQTTT